MYFKLKILKAFIHLRFNRWAYHFNLNKLRSKRFRQLQKKIVHSAFYKPFLEKGTALQDYPLMNKGTFMEHFNEINTCGIKLDDAYALAIAAEKSRDFKPMLNGFTIGLSTGTSGNRGVFIVSENERAFWVAAVIDRVIGFSFKKRKVAFFLRANSNLYESVKSSHLDFTFFDLLDPVESHVQKLNKIQPTILIAQPAMLMELAGKIESGVLTMQPEKIISIAEVLYPEDTHYLQKIFGQIIHQVYQCTEGFLAATCAHGTLHFNEDFLTIEKKYLDADKVRFHPVITDLLRISQPIIRYELNDIIHEKFNCPCGSKMTGIEQIEGRSDDIFILTDDQKSTIKIFPDFFRRVLITSNNNLQDYQLIQSGKDELMLFIHGTNAEYVIAEAAIQNFLHSKNIHTISILKMHNRKNEIGNKLRRIRNDYRQTD